MSLFELGRRIFNKKLDQHAAAAATGKVARADNDLPLGARIGSLIEVPRASFALLNNSLVQVPATAQLQVSAISRMRLDADADLGLYRLYTGCGANRMGDGESFLQVLTSADGIQDLAYYQFLFRQIPVTEDDQAPFLGKGFGLGETDYFMGTDQLRELGLTEAQIATLLGEEEALHFVRDTPGGDYVPPFTARENRIDDPYGETGLTQKVWFMQYARQLPDAGLCMSGGQERLLISFEVVDSFDGQSKPRVHVDFMIGLSLDSHKVKVL